MVVARDTKDAADDLDFLNLRSGALNEPSGDLMPPALGPVPDSAASLLLLSTFRSRLIVILIEASSSVET